MAEHDARSGEQTLLRVRTHSKILVGPALMQLVLLVGHWLVARYLPRDTGWNWFDTWAGLVLHTVFVLMAIGWVVLPVLSWLTSTFVVTDRRIQQEWGVLLRRSREIPLDRIVSVDTERGILDRIFGCGTLLFLDAGQMVSSTLGGPETRPGGRGAGIRFHDVPQVRQVQILIDQARYA